LTRNLGKLFLQLAEISSKGCFERKFKTGFPSQTFSTILFWLRSNLEKSGRYSLWALCHLRGKCRLRASGDFGHNHSVEDMACKGNGEGGNESMRKGGSLHLFLGRVFVLEDKEACTKVYA
jgi:hypothetical protein